MKAVMYHYVRLINKKLPYFNFLHINNFLKQLSYFEKKFGIITQNEFNNFFYLKKRIKNKILLTFDDGLYDHYKIYKILKKNKFFGIFFIPTYHLVKPDILPVHKIHLLIGKFKADEILLMIKKLKLSINEDLKKKFSNKYSKQKDERKIKLIKKILNFYSKDNKKNINLLFKSFFKKEAKSYTKNFYLNKKQLKEMSENGMKIGAHSHTHPVLSNLNYKSQNDEISKSINILKKICGLNIDTFCYPYGGFESFNDNVQKILKKNKINFAFNVQNKDITNKSIQLALPRYDCNVFKYGKILKKK